MSVRASPSPRRSRSPSPGVPADDTTRAATALQDTTDRSPSRARSDTQPKDVENPGNNLYVANLAKRMGQVELEELFAKFGRVRKCEVIMDPVTRESRYTPLGGL